MKIQKLTLLALILMISALTASAKTWTLKDGRTIDGEFNRVEGKWIVIEQSNGTEKPIDLSDLAADDLNYAKNLAAIFGIKPAAIESADPQMRVQIPGAKPAAKPVPKATPKPTPAPLPPVEKPEPAPAEIEPAPEHEISPAPPVPAPAVIQKVIIPPKPGAMETPVAVKAPEEKQTAKPGKFVVMDDKEKNLDKIRKPSKLIPDSDLERFSTALDSSLRKNRSITLYFLVLCLLILAHKMHMPHLYKTKFKPNRNRPKATLQKEFDTDDDRERFRKCPFCGITNETSSEECEHCGQLLK